MRKTKPVIAIFLAVIFYLSFMAACVSAKSIEERTSDVQHFVKQEAFTLTHPKEVTEIERSLIEGRTDVLNQYIPDPEDQEYYLRTENLSTAVSHILKTAYTTVNPQNSERYIVPTARIGGSETPRSQNSPVQKFTFLTMPNNSGNSITIDLYLVYQTRNGELTFLGILRNQSGDKISVNGISQIEIAADGKELANGTPASFESPMKMAPYQAQLNTGVYDGLPVMCFVKIVFEPGTYNPSIDVSNLDNIDCRYSLDYTIIS